MEKDQPTAKNDDTITIALTKAEALVLFELLHRVDKQQEGTIVIEHQAEQRVLWDIEAMLESVLVEPFDANYRDHLARARLEVQDDLS